MEMYRRQCMAGLPLIHQPPHSKQHLPRAWKNVIAPFRQQHPQPPLQLSFKDNLCPAPLQGSVLHHFLWVCVTSCTEVFTAEKDKPWLLTRVSGNEILADSTSSCPSWGLLGIPHPPELKCTSANGRNCGLMAYASKAVWSSTFPFLPTVGVRALSPFQEPTGNATVKLYASIAVCTPVSPLRLVIKKLHHYKYKKTNFLLLLSFSSSCHTAWPPAIFFPLGFICWCDAISTGCKKLTVTCQCINSSWLRDAGVRTIAFGGSPPRQLGSF